MNALDDARHNEAAGHFTAAVNTIGFSSMSPIHSEYDVFVVVGWSVQLKSFFHCAFSSYSGGTSSPCGELHTRIGAMRSFGQVDFQKPSRHTDT